MVGYVGLQAKRRRRNRVFFLLIILFIFILVFYLPTIDLSTEEKKLPNEILPDSIDDKSSLISEIEELKLEVFQKDQRIKFRDNQISDLTSQLKDIKQSLTSLETEYNRTVGNLSTLEDSLSENSSENLNEIKKLNDKIKELNVSIQDYKEQITNLKQEVNDAISAEDYQNMNIENSILKNEIKLIKDKNFETESILKELQNTVEEKQKEIDKLLYLKDLSHHG